jgi:hypothetical protein
VAVDVEVDRDGRVAEPTDTTPIRKRLGDQTVGTLPVDVVAKRHARELRAG